MTRARSVEARLLAAGLLAALLAVPATGLAQTSNGVAGEAYAAYVQVASTTQERTPLAVLDPALGLVESAVASVAVFDLLAAKALDASASGAIGENAATSQSRSSAADVRILGGVVTAELVLAMASSASNGIRATSNAAGSSILGLVVNGVSLGDVEPTPNTRIEIPGVGTVILNEQLASGGGANTSGLAVRMIHVVLKDPLTGAKTGDIIVGAAESRASFFR